jgi:hypothetical protein
MYISEVGQGKRIQLISDWICEISPLKYNKDLWCGRKRASDGLFERMMYGDKGYWSRRILYLNTEQTFEDTNIFHVEKFEIRKNWRGGPQYVYQIASYIREKLFQKNILIPEDTILEVGLNFYTSERTNLKIISCPNKNLERINFKVNYYLRRDFKDLFVYV